MNVSPSCPGRGPIHLIGVTVRHTVLLLLIAAVPAGLSAQPVPGSIVNSPATVSASNHLSVDATGNVYAVMYTTFAPITEGALQSQPGGGRCSAFRVCPDAYVSKRDAADNLLFATYLGGPRFDTAEALAVDTAGNVFVTGRTEGLLPTTANAAIVTSTSGFAAKISADGKHLLYSTYLPDSVANVHGIAIDGQGNAYVAGTSRPGDAIVVKVRADGSAFDYIASFGGAGLDEALHIVADAAGNLVIAGRTESSDFPTTTGAHQRQRAGAGDVFVARLNAAGSVVMATYLGGKLADSVNRIATGASGTIFLAGETSSTDFPTTAGSFQPDALIPLWNERGPGGFVAAVSPEGSLLWSTYVMSRDQGIAELAVGPSGDVYAAAITGAGFPVTPSAPQPCFDGGAVVAHFDSKGALLDATYAGKAFNITGLRPGADGAVTLYWLEQTLGGRRSNIRFGSGGWTAPSCLSPHILNAATFTSSTRGITFADQTIDDGDPIVAPAELVSLTGFGIGPEIGVPFTLDAQNRAPLSLGGVQVLFDGQPAPLLYVQSQQINAISPSELSGKTSATITVIYNGVTVGTAMATVVAGFPGVLRVNPGYSLQPAAINEDGTVNSEANPALRGSILSLWGTAFGPLSPNCTTGELNPPQPIGMIGGFGPSLGGAWPVPYAGSSPGLLCGVQQMQFVALPNWQPGPHDVSIRFAARGGLIFVNGALSFTIWSK